MDIENRIILLLKVVYPLSLEHVDEILDSLKSIWEEEKKKILIVVYERYENYMNGINALKRNVTIAWNNLEEVKEKQDIDDLLKEII